MLLQIPIAINLEIFRNYTILWNYVFFVDRKQKNNMKFVSWYLILYRVKGDVLKWDSLRINGIDVVLCNVLESSFLSFKYVQFHWHTPYIWKYLHIGWSSLYIFPKVKRLPRAEESWCNFRCTRCFLAFWNLFLFPRILLSWSKTVSLNYSLPLLRNP